jgi:uncharacterized protein (DUF3820 family)
MADFEAELERLLRLTAGMRMPFGKFGPKECPPNGVPVYDLPYEYLRYFERRGYPKGSLGAVMKFVHDLKRDGADDVFAPIRKAAGGRVSLRQRQRRRWNFNDGR